MIEAYFLQLEQTIREFPNVRYLSLTKKIYNASQGYIAFPELVRYTYFLAFCLLPFA
ncbi:hypothetical protein NIES3804_29010 [Microcystis aeruginosa NIES-3804]|jgi:hypothetical protein|uniref:Uncharacterized protein n=1 Tax=Microcystis aeruginosa NIES-3804 TaxID=2517783 RepID=A0A6H9GYN5_MICAE|nr:hypothetical protein NIES3804_29010 [Microcystis aeruginosa NIES-3804]